jgi:hypothetical protein
MHVALAKLDYHNLCVCHVRTWSFAYETEKGRRERRKGKEYKVSRVGIRMKFITKMILSFNYLDTAVLGEKLHYWLYSLTPSRHAH